MAEVEKKEVAAAPASAPASSKSSAEPTAETLPSSVWVKHSFGAFDEKPEVVAAALTGVTECSREEAKKAIEDFLKSPASFGD